MPVYEARVVDGEIEVVVDDEPTRTCSRSRGLRAGVAGKEILKGIDLTVRSGEVHAIMGPNGSGKSTLSHVIMGRPGYEVLGGTVTLDGVDLLGLAPWERAQAGLFLAMQYPTEVPGVAVVDVLRGGLRRPAAATRRRRRAASVAEAERIGFDDRFLHRAMNVDLSGGEKKRNETLQLGVLEPGHRRSSTSSTPASTSTRCGPAPAASRPPPRRPGLGVLAITHYNRLLHELQRRPRARARRRRDPALRRPRAGRRARAHRLRRFDGRRRAGGGADRRPLRRPVRLTAARRRRAP